MKKPTIMQYLRNISISLVLVLIISGSYAQVAINTDGSNPDSSAMLDIKSTTGGLLIPRMDRTDRNLISSPATGLLVYATDDSTFYFYNGNDWVRFAKDIWITNGNYIYTVSDSIGIGTATPIAELDVHGRIAQTGTGNSVFIGEGAGENDDLTDNRNVFVGQFAGKATSTGHKNSAFGYQSFYTNTTGIHNTAIGYKSLHMNTIGDYNIAVGTYALYDNTEGFANTAVGINSLEDNTTGYYNTASGFISLQRNDSGSLNTAYGYASLMSNISGWSNIAIGHASLLNNNTGNHNIAIGSLALSLNGSGSFNIAIGSRALHGNTTKSYLVAIGDSALYNNGIGASTGEAVYNTAIGSKALYLNTKGYSNTSVGYQSLCSNTTGYKNSSFGYQSGYSNTEGAGNTFMGHISGYMNATGGLNTYIGDRSGYRGNGSKNTYLGYKSGHNTLGSENTYLGYKSGEFDSIGNFNVGVGFTALRNNFVGSYNTALGYSAFSHDSTCTNSTALGHNAEPGASNRIMLGNNSVTWIGGHSTWHNTSDARMKDNIQENVVGLDFILQLRPVTYFFDIDKMNELTGITDSSDYAEKYDKEKITQSGFLAQEVEMAAKKTDYDFSGVCAPKGDVKYYSMAYAEFVVPLVKAVQEQQSIIDGQKAINTEQWKIITELQEEINLLKRKIK